MEKDCTIGRSEIEALFDGELDAVRSAELEAHLGACARCRAVHDELARLRAVLRADGLRPAAPARLAASLEHLAAPPPAPRRIATAWAGGMASGALAASLAAILLTPQAAEPALAIELVSDHVRSLQPGHLVDVLTSDRHTVKPWFNGRIDFSPPVVDLAAAGFPLVGGRLDVLGGRTVASLVYRRRLHTINVFVRPIPASDRGSASRSFERDSYALRSWRQGGLEFWAVSDIPPGELDQFARAFSAAAQGASEPRA